MSHCENKENDHRTYRTTTVRVTELVRVIEGICIAVEELPIAVSIRRDRINREKCPDGGVVVPLLHVAQTRCSIAHMPGIARPISHFPANDGSIGLIGESFDDVAGCIGLGHRRAQGIGVDIGDRLCCCSPYKRRHSHGDGSQPLGDLLCLPCVHIHLSSTRPSTPARCRHVPCNHPGSGYRGRSRCLLPYRSRRRCLNACCIRWHPATHSR